MILIGGSRRVIRGHELTDAEWNFVQPLLPRTSMAWPRLDDRTMLNGIVWKFRSGVAWRGCARAVRIRGQFALPFPPLGSGWHVRSDAAGSAGPGE
ncbi:transposase [Streptomyces sp900105245]|uniref:Transposase n=1 Tax=Streptomyces sp. 900105245 TaxID=3154379 RepID=A0ABV1UMW1_9ACTN